MTEPCAIDFSAVQPVSHDAGVHDSEAEVAGARWALVEYSPGSGRAEWCDTPHAGFVVSGTITYTFEDGRESTMSKVNPPTPCASPGESGCSASSTMWPSLTEEDADDIRSRNVDMGCLAERWRQLAQHRAAGLHPAGLGPGRGRRRTRRRRPRRAVAGRDNLCGDGRTVALFGRLREDCEW